MVVTDLHEEKNTFTVDVNIPGHGPRVTTALFKKSRLYFLQRDGGRCWVCNCTDEETGYPLVAHHYPVERSFAEMIDWSAGSQILRDFPSFGWGNFDESDPYSFVDDMNVNGRLFCKAHHTGKEGYTFSDMEIIHHYQVAEL